MAFYLTNKEFLNQLKISNENNELTPETIQSFIILTNRISCTLKYKNPDDKEDCKQVALERCIKYWDRFDASLSSNPFSYFTTVIKNGLAHGWRELHKDMSATQFTRLSEKNSFMI